MMSLFKKGTNTVLTCCLSILILCVCPTSTLGDTPPAIKIENWNLESLPTDGDEHLNISGIILNNDETLLVVGTEERSHIQVLKKTGEMKFVLLDGGNVPLGLEETELDVEGIARDNDYIWVIGSHSMKRKLTQSPEELKEKADDGSPILEIKLKDTYYLSLDGRGIRGMSEMDKKIDGYLVLAGPVGDKQVPYMLYHWNGKDTVPEIDALDAKQNVTQLCLIAPPDKEPKAKPEGVHFLAEEGGFIKFVIVYDTAVNGAPTVFSCKSGHS